MAGMPKAVEEFPSRYEAARILRKVADWGEHGLFPNDVTAEDLGLALRRLCANSPEANVRHRLWGAWAAMDLGIYQQVVSPRHQAREE